MKNIFKKIQSALIITSLLVLSSMGVAVVVPSTPSTVYALGCDDDFYGENGVDFYSPEGCDSVCSNVSASALVGAGNLPLETSDYLKTVAQIDQKIADNKPRYVYAANETGVMWQAVAALHFRQANLDPGRSILTGELLGNSVDEATGESTPTDPNADAKMAAERFIEVSGGTYQIDPSRLTKDSPGSDWGRAFLAYHAGTTFKESGKDYTDSTYVVNGIDQNKQNMSWLGAPYETETGVDELKAGALTVLKYLDAVNDASGCAGYGAVTGDIVETGINLALPTPATNGMTQNSQARPSYLEAYGRVNSRAPTGIEVTDCGRFVSVVIRSSGADSQFPVVGTDAQVAYMQGSSRYMEVTDQELMPGDILVYNSGVRGDGNYAGHIMLYTGPNGSYVAVDASLGQRVPSVRAQSNVEWMRQQPNYSAWRLNG